MTSRVVEEALRRPPESRVLVVRAARATLEAVRPVASTVVGVAWGDAELRKKAAAMVMRILAPHLRGWRRERKFTADF